MTFDNSIIHQFPIIRRFHTNPLAHERTPRFGRSSAFPPDWTGVYQCGEFALFPQIYTVWPSSQFTLFILWRFLCSLTLEDYFVVSYPPSGTPLACSSTYLQFRILLGYRLQLRSCPPYRRYMRTIPPIIHRCGIYIPDFQAPFTCDHSSGRKARCRRREVPFIMDPWALFSRRSSMPPYAIFQI